MATGIGTKIRRARERKRWSQRELAEHLGVNRKTVDNWENGRTQPASSIGALEDILGISLDDADEDSRSPPRELPADLQELMRQRVGEEMAAALIAHYGHLVSGRTAPAGGDCPPESAGKDQRTTGLARIARRRR